MFIYSFVIILLALIFYKAYPYLNPAPTCFDHKMNGDEAGVDCGGGCELSCHNEVIPVEVKFARAVKTEDNLYDLIAMVQNKNTDKDVSDGIINYKFSVYDKSGSLIFIVSGSSSLPVGQTFPVIIQNVPLDLSSSGNDISKVVCEVSFNSQDWVKVDPIYGNNFFKIESTDFQNDKNNISQLTVSLTDTTKASFKNVPVRVTLEDGNGNFIAVNETILPEIKSAETRDISFTWRSPLGIENPKITVYPIVTPITEFK